MDAPEADFDIKLQKISGDLIRDFDTFLPIFLTKKDRNGAPKTRSRVRAREVNWATNNCLDPFQELPQLLDPHLPKWIPYLSQAFLDFTTQSKRRGGLKDERAKHLVSTDYAICKILYTFCKIRGEKVVVHFLNVETKYLEVLLSAIEEAEGRSPDDESAWSWEQRYVVLLWLSHLMLAPFDLSTVSSVDTEDVSTSSVPSLVLPDGLPGIALRVIPLAIKYLASPGKERDGAKALLVRMAMRRDMQQLGLLKSLVQWAVAALQPKKDEAPETTYFYLGVLSFLAGMLRSSADTSDLNDFLRPIFDVAHGISAGEAEGAKSITSFALARKMIIKVIRSVIVSLLRQGKQDEESTEMTEMAIGHLLESLSDNDTPVRLAASKSLSILTLKLDPDMASQVVEAVLESLNKNVLWKKTPEAKPLRDLSAVDHLEWHGLVLTLSHLLYRRSPPADQLSDIIHALLLGLSFEQRGTSGASVGSNVRDAACFGIWALARRYTTAELLSVPTTSVYAAKAHPESSSILQVLATELVTTGCLDPAGNIRRGSSAALQELIGRHPDTVEKGIWVVQTVDYHDVARRSRAMRDVALGVTKLSSQYGDAIIDGLLGWRGIGDPDVPSRRDAGAAFGILTTELIASTSDKTLSRLETWIGKLFEQLKGLAKRQVEERHGLLLCLAAELEQVPVLLKDTLTGESESQLTTKALSAATWVLEDVQANTYRRPELVVEAASRLVVSLLPIFQLTILKTEDLQLQTMEQLISTQGYSALVSTLDVAESSNAEVAKLLSILQDVVPIWLARTEAEITESTSLAALTLLLFSSDTSRAKIMADWAKAVKHKPSSRTAIQGGSYFYTLAMAQPLISTLSSEDNIVCEALLGRWAEDQEVDTRVAILQALTRSRILEERPQAFLDLLRDGLNDYTTTARGDVGSHVRVQALRAVRVLWERLPSADPEDEQLAESIERLIYSVLRLSAEKLDRVRPEAQLALSLCLARDSAAVFSDMTFSSQPYFTTLLSLFTTTNLHPLLTATRTRNALLWNASILAGYVTSADTGNEDLVIASRGALTAFCTSSQTSLDAVAQALMSNLKTHQGNDRVIVPTLEIIAFLFHVGLWQGSQGVGLKGLCLYTQKAGYKSGNLRKIEACVRVYGAIAGMDNLKEGETTDGSADAIRDGVKEARKRLGALLLHPWPKVRVMVVDELWGLLGQDGERLLAVDWGEAKKAAVQDVVKELSLI